MSISIPTPENFKSKAKVVRQFLKEKCNVDVSHSHCIELISQIYGFKDWNTAKAELSSHDRIKAASITPKKREAASFVQGMTVGELKKALEGYEDSAAIDADYEFILGEFINSIEEMENPKESIHQEFVIVDVEKVDVDYASLKLRLNSEDISFEL